MSDTQHTPTPYIVRDKVFVVSMAQGGRWIANCDRARDGDEANAKFVCIACNSHDDLLAACELARPSLANWMAISIQSSQVALDAIDAAIAKAKGEQK